jgi:carbonic anhydrase
MVSHAVYAPRHLSEPGGGSVRSVALPVDPPTARPTTWRFTTRLLLPLIALIGVSCAGDETEPVSATSDGHAHWSYEGETGPEHWAGLDPSFVACADGSAQTPIDLVDPEPVELTDPEFTYVAGPVKVHNNGHTVQADAAPGGVLRVDGAEFPLAQLHFHAPSEHTIGGESVPVEVHFVHKTSDDEIAVVGVMMTEGETANPAWAPFVDALGVEETDADIETEFDWKAMLPASTSTLRYAGSLTTPPCTEGVRWFIMAEPVELSAAQIGAFEAAYDANNRPLQPLNDRPVVLDAADGGN